MHSLDLVSVSFAPLCLFETCRYEGQTEPLLPKRKPYLQQVSVCVHVGTMNGQYVKLSPAALHSHNEGFVKSSGIVTDIGLMSYVCSCIVFYCDMCYANIV